MKVKNKKRQKTTRINEMIKSTKVRLIDENNDNIGVVPTKEAIEKARAINLDIVEISEKTDPPIVKIVDYGKYKYLENKKNKGVTKKSAGTQVKNIQIKIVTSQDAIDMRKEQIEKWLNEGHRIKVDLFLFGRYKFMEEKFLKSRLQGFLDLITTNFTIIDDIKKSHKGMSVIIQGKKIQKQKNENE